MEDATSVHRSSQGGPKFTPGLLTGRIKLGKTPIGVVRVLLFWHDATLSYVTPTLRCWNDLHIHVLPIMTVTENEALQTALAKAEADYVAANPRSHEAFKTASANLPGGGTRATLAAAPFPLYVSSAQGSKLTAVDGREYRDL